VIEVVTSRRLLLVRHGLPDYRFGLPGDEPPGPPLSEIGRAQIRQATRVVARPQPAAIHSSPLARTRQTAEIIGHALGLPVAPASDLKEWHRTEQLYQVNERNTRWLCRWLAGDEPCAVVVGHASPLLAIIRSALYLPHSPWWRADDPDDIVVGTGDRFEVSMGSVFEIMLEPRHVTARQLFHPEPRILCLRRGRPLRGAPRATIGGENLCTRRPNFTHLLGYR
jgi:broad specificity phosphatase PhoE